MSVDVRAATATRMIMLEGEEADTKKTRSVVAIEDDDDSAEAKAKAKAVVDAAAAALAQVRATHIGNYEVKVWDEKWEFPQAFYGFCVPVGTTVAEIRNEKMEGNMSIGVVRDMWGKRLSDDYVFNLHHATQPFFTSCSGANCELCNPVREYWRTTRDGRFTWICIALKRWQEFGVKLPLPKDVIRLIAQFM